jgi:hypothetical protein
MAWKFNQPGAGAPAAQPAAAAPQPAAASAVTAPAQHPLAPPTALPAMQTPPAAQPPAAAEPAPKQPRKRRSASEMAAAAPAPTAPAAQPAAVMPQLQTAAPTAPAAAPVTVPAQPLAVIPAQASAGLPAVLPAGGWLTMFTPQDPSRTSGSAVIAAASQKGGEPNIFPTVYLTGGDQGGMLDYDEMNEEGSDDALPTGRKPFGAILMTYRHVVLGWPRGANPNGPKVQPRFRGIIGALNPAEADIATNAQRKYQFRQGRPKDKGAPEPFYDSLCHPAMAVEALLFEPEAGIMVVRSTFTFESMSATTAQINGAFPKNEKGQPIICGTPVTVQPRSWKVESKSQPNGWLEHGVDYTPAPAPLSAEMQQVVAAFQGFYQQAGMNQELFAALSEWAKHTLSQHDLDVLQQIING